MRRRFRSSWRNCFNMLVAAVVVAAAASANAQDFIDLADIVAGGDGHGTGGGANGEREFSAIDIDTGAFLPMDQIVVGFNGDVDGVNPSPVDGSDLVDSVFYLTEQEMAINSAGATFTFAEGDPADESFGPILSNLTWEFEEGNTAIRAGGSEWTSGVGIHASAGVTFDLAALRTQHGAANVHTLSAFAGTPPEDCSPANFYIIYSSADGVLENGVFQVQLGGDDGVFYFEPIPPAATFLTLAVGAADSELCADGGAFAHARILPEGLAVGDCTSLSASPEEAFVAVGGTQPLRVTCFDADGLPKDVSATAEGTAYDVMPAGIASVDASGVVTGVAPGEAEITITNNNVSIVVPVIVADPDVCVGDLDVSPRNILLRPGGSQQLSASCVNGFGDEIDLAGAAAGTTYAVAPAGVVEVSEDGLVSAIGQGKAVIAVTNGPATIGVSLTVVEFLSLADFVAGGDGTGTGGGDVGDRETTAIQIDDGQLLTELELNLAETSPFDGERFSTVDDSDFVDGVFFMDADSMAINTAEVEVVLQAGDPAPNATGDILSNFTPAIVDDVREIVVGQRDDWTSAVGIGAASGVTFDLLAMREEYGAEAVHTFTCFAGRTCFDISPGQSTAYIIYTNENEILQDPNAEGDVPYWFRRLGGQDGETYRGEIPPEATFLTLAEGSGGGDTFCDYGTFANAVILPDIDIDCTSMSIVPSALTLQPGGESQLEVVCLDALGLPSDLTTAASGTTYSVEPAGVVEVGPDGGVTVMGTGAATITATNGDLTATASVSVATFISLADLVAGGDGLGTGGGDRGTREFTGIDIDTGALATEEEVIARFNGGGQVAEADGINPSSVEGTPFIDSVLFMNEQIMPINSEGVEVEWDVEDVDASGWSHILSNFTFLLEAGDRTINVAGRTDWDENVGVHAAAGVTFDLDHLREVHGADAVHTFSTTAGQSAADCGETYVTLYIIYSSATDIIEDPAAGGDDLFWKRRVVNLDGGEVQLEEYNSEIPPEASFLTLATGVAGDSWPCDMGAFANARILAAPSGGGGKEFRRGDSDANGSVNITDAVSVLNHLFGGATEPLCFEAADINNDGQTNITDPVALLNHLFGQGPPPADPGLETCGPDPEGTGPDGTTLGCAQYDTC